jgi:hypothetical protein
MVKNQDKDHKYTILSNFDPQYKNKIKIIVLVFSHN